MRFQPPSRLSNSELLATVKRLAGCERAATVDLIVHLAELDKRGLHLAAGFSSLFRYCTEVLRLSEYGAYHRILAARMARRFPLVIRLLSDGLLTLTSVRLLSPHLATANSDELFAASSGKSKRELQELLARLFPRPDVVASIRKLPAPRPETDHAVMPRTDVDATTPSTGVGAPLLLETTTPRVADLLAPPQTARHHPPEVPLAPDRYQIAFTASKATRDKLLCLRDLMRHSIPSGDTAAIIDEALAALLEKVARRKFAETACPRPSRETAEGSRHVPASIRRAVWVRDLGRCAFVSKDGRRCGERGFVEFHHVVPYALGGPANQSNLELRCRAHNVFEADLSFGPQSPHGLVREEWAAYGR